MNNAILILGPSGSGKSTSLRNLNHEQTFLINVLDKPLPWKSFKKDYFPMNKEGGGNYYATDDFDAMVRCIRYINEKRLDIKTLVLDDFQHIMTNAFMRRASEKGFEKFTDLGRHIWMVIEEIKNCRDDLFCCVLTHSDLDSNGNSKMKTIGRMVDEKVDIPSRFTVVFHTMVIDGKYKFLTQNNGLHLAKSPMGMFEEQFIENDIAQVIETIHTYYNEGE